MIDEERTLETFGYTSDEWSPQSHKKVVAICERCGKEKIVEKRAARPLCTSCGKVGRYFSPDTLRLKSINMTGEKNPMYGRRGSAHPSFGIPLSEETKRKLSEANMGRKASEETKAKMSARVGRRGKDSNFWKGGITPVMKRIRHSKSYKNWRTLVYKRDDYTCQMCHVRGGKLEAHHIRPVRDHKNDLLIYDVDNGITLCKRCHASLVHHEYDYIDIFEDTIGGVR